mmetsp:Transcript_161/g.759  ORF Transcript_161/g.759 Transcript_161/m.759 type:complete len:672 (+) Transcript_161:45-2060(+)
MQCPGCDYTVTGNETGYPCRTHCCQTCEWCPGRHGPRCARLLSAYAERPRACPGCHTYAVTGISSTHCCRGCAFNGGQHGDFCHRREVHWSLREEYSKTLEHRLLLSRVRAMEGVQPVDEVAPPNIDRCAYVMLLFGSDVEYALGALLVASSLRRAGARAQLVLLYTKDVPETRLELVRLFYDEVRLLSDPIRLPDDSPLCVCSRDFAHPQFLKLHLLELDFDKVLYLDCDVVVRRNLDGLFAMDTPAAMERIMPMPRHGEKLPNRVCYDGRRVRGIQGGVMLLAPDQNLFATMRAEVEGWRGDEHCRSFRASIGNEQDYLTWRYCEGLVEEEGHPRVWTHLGCEYNCEVHKESMYFAIGRERWLWLDYVRDAAVLHFSAPFRKRAKRLLQHHLGDQGSGKTDESDEDARVELAHGIWDEAVEHLRAEVALRGFDLSAWLGSGAGAHAAAFEVVERGEDEGMEISQLSTASASNARGLVFEAFTSNCATGLVYCPPGFTPGPACSTTPPRSRPSTGSMAPGGLQALCAMLRCNATGAAAVAASPGVPMTARAAAAARMRSTKLCPATIFRQPLLPALRRSSFSAAAARSGARCRPPPIREPSWRASARGCAGRTAVVASCGLSAGCPILRTFRTARFGSSRHHFPRRFSGVLSAQGTTLRKVLSRDALCRA